MHFTTMDIVMAAIGILALLGAVISISAWRHAVRAERDAERDANQTGLPSAV